MTIKITDKERELILDGLRTAAARMNDFADSFKMHGDAPNSLHCINTAYIYNELANKIERETAK